jgi:hypothetical protein
VRTDREAVRGFTADQLDRFSDDERIVAAGTRGVYFLKRIDA